MSGNGKLGMSHSHYLILSHGYNQSLLAPAKSFESCLRKKFDSCLCSKNSMLSLPRHWDDHLGRAIRLFVLGVPAFDCPCG